MLKWTTLFWLFIWRVWRILWSSKPPIESVVHTKMQDMLRFLKNVVTKWKTVKYINSINSWRKVTWYWKWFWPSRNQRICKRRSHKNLFSIYKKNSRLESFCVEKSIFYSHEKERDRQVDTYERHLAITLTKNESKIAPTHLAATQMGKVVCCCFCWLFSFFFLLLSLLLLYKRKEWSKGAGCLLFPRTCAATTT